MIFALGSREKGESEGAAAGRRNDSGWCASKALLLMLLAVVLRDHAISLWHAPPRHAARWVWWGGAGGGAALLCPLHQVLMASSTCIRTRVFVICASWERERERDDLLCRFGLIGDEGRVQSTLCACVWGRLGRGGRG